MLIQKRLCIMCIMDAVHGAEQYLVQEMVPVIAARHIRRLPMGHHNLPSCQPACQWRCLH